MVRKLAQNSSHLTRGLVKSVPGRGYFRAVPSQNRDKYVTSPPSPIVELVYKINHATPFNFFTTIHVGSSIQPRHSNSSRLQMLQMIIYLGSRHQYVVDILSDHVILHLMNPNKITCIKSLVDPDPLLSTKARQQRNSSMYFTFPLRKPDCTLLRLW